MKKSSVNSRQFHGSVENSKITLKYNALLEDYLKQQKVYVSRKKKLQVEKQKREILLDEVRFLRQRHLYLIKSQCAETEPELHPHQNSDINDVPVRNEANHFVKKTYIEQEGNRSMKELMWKASSIEKKSMDFSINEKKRGKRIKVALKV